MNPILRFLAEDEHDDHDDHGGEHSDDDKIMTARIIMIIFVILVGCVVFIPYTRLVKKNEDGEQEQEVSDTKICSGRVHQFSNCFAAGMLFSLSIVHILPEALEAYATYKATKPKDDHDDHDDHRRLFAKLFARGLAEDDHDDHGHGDGANFPLVFFFFVLGFLFMLLLDQVLFKKYESKDQ